MTVIRVKHTDQYVVIKKTALEDPSLSFKAKGLWAYCMSRPNDWEFNITHLATVSKEKEVAVYSAIKELIRAGYAVRNQENKGRGEGRGRGSFGKTDYIIYEDCQIKNSFTLRGFADAGHADACNQGQLSIDPKLSNEEQTNTPLSPQGDLVRFGNFVKLKEEEIQPLANLVGGKEALMGLVEEINDYLASTGKKPYKDYAATIRSWWRRRSGGKNSLESSSVTENISLSKNILRLFPNEVQKNHIQLQEKGILFCYTGCWDEINFTENGFKDRVLSRLIKMNLSIKDLK